MSKVFSGIRPSGKLHLGNYLGAIKNWIELQHNAEQAIFGVVDLHGITTPYDPAAYQEQVMDAVMDFLAAGVDPSKSLLVRQSHIPQHTELMWLFSTITPVGWLERLPNYREKVQQVEAASGERAKSYQNNFGLLSYPVLMAADILIYKSNLVPVGEDQLLHLNLTNEIGAKFNHLFPGRLPGQGTGGETFEPVKPHLTEGARIMSLQDPSKKMSKTPSAGSGQAADHYIALTDDPDTIRTKIKKAVTDSGKDIKYDEKEKPAIANLLTIYHLLSGRAITDLEKEYAGKTYVQFKEDLAEVIVEFLRPFQEKYTELKKNPDHVQQILRDSEEKARVIAEANLTDIRHKMGL